MSFWKKLFGAGKNSEPAVNARSARIRLLLADGARFEGDEGVFPLLNISESGLGLLAEDGLTPGFHEGKLYLGDAELPVELEVVRRSGTFAGARFRKGGDLVKSALRRLFLEEIRATEMSEVSAAALQGAAVPKGTPRWYYAAGNYELFFVEVDGAPAHLEMEWNGRVVAAEKGGRARTGTIRPEDREKPGHAKSSLVQWEDSLGDENRSKAIRILENVTGLDPRVRGMLVAMLR